MSCAPLVFMVPAEWHKQRLDRFLSTVCPEMTRSYLGKLIGDGHVSLDGQAVTKAGHNLRQGTTVRLELPVLQATELTAEAIPLAIVYEDSALLVIDKPAGLVVHPGAGHRQGTLVHALLHHCRDLSGIGGVERPGIVHRLDKDTSGLLVVAKTDQAHQHLSRQLAAKTMRRQYLALVEDNLREDSGTVDAPVGRHPVDRKRMAVVAGGREARTHWQVLERFRLCVLLELVLDTGRTHQIRVHMRHIHHPIVGDPLYGSRRPFPYKVFRPMLHACRLELEHPLSGELMSFAAPLPPDFSALLAWLHSSLKAGSICGLPGQTRPGW